MKYFLIISFLLYFHVTDAQERSIYKKLTPELEELIYTAKDSTKIVDILVKGDSSLIKTFLEQNGGFSKYTVGKISSIRIPICKIISLASLSTVSKLNYHDEEKDFLCNDTARRKNNVDLVQEGHSPLLQPYTGKNVIIGLLEPVDRHHPDFQDSLGHTRILYCWSGYDTTGTPPSGFGYGSEYSSSDIDNGLADSFLSGDDHGTACAGVACGNARANGLSKGMAPEANMIVASRSIIDNMKYIFDKASSLGMPCVISISKDLLYSPQVYFSQSLYFEVMDSLVTAQPGRAIVVANGNIGNVNYHYHFSSTTDTLESFSHFLWLSGDTASLKGIRVSYAAYKDSMTNPFPTFSTPFLSYDSLVNPIDFMLCGNDSLPSSTWRYKITTERLVDQDFGFIRMYKNGLPVLNPNNGEPDCDSLSTYYWKIRATGQGEGDFTGFPFLDSIPSRQLYPNNQNYMFPDSMSNLNGYGISEKVIAVGYAQSRASHIDYNNNLVTDPNAYPDELTVTSGHGPTLRGVLKPDIVATANYVMTAMPISRQADAIANFPYSIDQGAFHIKEGGSSMAAPLVAGGIALFFEKYPNATWLDVKNAIINCPKVDSFTGVNLPNNFWGYGKFNAFGLLTNCAPDYVQESHKNSMKIFPNPSSGNVHFKWTEKKIGVRLSIFSSNGKLVRTILPSSSVNEIIVDGLQSGIYFYHYNNLEILETGKIVVIE